MAETKMVGVRVSKRRWERLKAESIARSMSVQDVVACALDLFLESPKHWDYVSAVFVTHNTKKNREAVAEMQAWTRLWQRYMSQMPRLKITHLVEFMELDLAKYIGARRRRPRKARP